MSETGIEEEREYSRAIARVEAGVSLLVWLVVYATALVVVALDVFMWRAG